MSPTRNLIKTAVDILSDSYQAEKIAVVPVDGGQIPPPQGAVTPGMPPGMTPAMAGGPGGPPGGMPPGMDPSMAGGPPMDPSMMGPPPGAGGPPPGGAPPMDPSMMGPPPGPPPDAGANPNDPAVPLSAIAGFTTAIIEATKGKRTADPKDPNSMDPAAQDPAAADGMPSAIANIGGAPSDAPAPLPGMPATGGPPKAARAIDDILSGIHKSRGYRK